MRKLFAVMQKGDYGSRTAKRRNVQKPIRKVVQKKCANAKTGAESHAEPRAVVRTDVLQKNGTDANSFADAEHYAVVRAVPRAEQFAEAFADVRAEKWQRCRNKMQKIR